MSDFVRVLRDADLRAVTKDRMRPAGAAFDRIHHLDDLEGLVTSRLLARTAVLHDDHRSLLVDLRRCAAFAAHVTSWAGEAFNNEF